MLNRKHIIKEFKRSWSQHFIVQLSTLMVLTATFTVIFSVFSLLGNLKSVLSKWGKDIQVTVFLEEELSKENLSEIEQSLRSLNDFTSVQYINKTEARNRFVKQMPGFAKDVVQDADFSNPFPASYQLGGLPSKKINQLPDLAKKISSINGVEDVSYGQEWVDNYSGFLASIAQSGWFLILTLTLGSLFVISNSVRVALSQRREEIEILELVGATPAMIRAPYVFEGAFMGMGAALLAVGLTYLIYIVEVHVVSSEMSFLGVSEVFEFFSIGSTALLILFGLSAGGLGAYLCVRRFNTGWAASQKVSRRK